MGTTFFLSMRVLHVLLAATWIGATVFMSFLLMPVINASGPAGGQIMIGLNKRGITPFFAALGGLTVLTGIYLYWRFTGGFDPEVSRTHAGMAFGIGGIAGILATILGGAIVGRSSKKIVDLMEEVGRISDAGRKGAIMQQIEALKQRIATFGGVVLVLQVIAAALMAVGHYI
jgi:hypothetical protein